MRYYIESDGRIYLVKRDGVHDLPEPDEVPFQVHRIAPLATEPETWFCIPVLDRHPHEWPQKDRVSGRNDVSPLVRCAVHASMPRVVVEAICLRDDEILLVKGSRGLNKDRWSLPGGFLQFGETPESGLLREISEELGVDASILRFLSAEAKVGPVSRLQWVMLFYEASLHSQPKPDPDEIAEARYIRTSEATQYLHDPIMARIVLSCRSDGARTTGASSQPTA